MGPQLSVLSSRFQLDHSGMLNALTLPVCPGVPGIRWPTLPRVSTKHLVPLENSQSLSNWDGWSPYETCEWEYNLELRSWKEVTLASALRPARHPPTGLASSLPLGPAGQQQPGNPGKHVAFHWVSNREGGWRTDRQMWQRIHFSCKSTAEDNLNSSKLTVGGKESKWWW